MNNSMLLDLVAGRKPLFDMEYAILSAPVRHLFIIASIWYLSQEKKRLRDTQQPRDLQILEVGSWIGASALSWAQGLRLYNDSQGTITCIDAWQPYFNRELQKDNLYLQMERMLSSEAAYQLFCHNINTIPSPVICQHLRGKSSHLLPLLCSNTFDVIYIDGDHAYSSVVEDIKHSLSLVKENGILCGDDLNLQLFQVDKEKTLRHAQEDVINDDKSKRNYHPGVTLAVAEIFGEVSAWGGFWAMQKKEGDWHKISLKDMPINYPEHFPTSALTKAKEHLKDIQIN